MLPAIMIVTPKSPSARAKASAVAASKPREASGKVTRKQIIRPPRPSVRAAATRKDSLMGNQSMLPAKYIQLFSIRDDGNNPQWSTAATFDLQRQCYDREPFVGEPIQVSDVFEGWNVFGEQGAMAFKEL